MKKVELLIVSIIVLLGAFLRLYQLPEALMFRGDQGRDAIIAKNILKENDIALIGPVTSVGNMYLGPLYYYFMVPFLALTYPDPVGPAYGVALLNILTIYLIYWVGKKTSSAPVGLIAAALFALMPMAIIYGRFSWNPNIAPFFSILIFYSLYRWWQTRSLKVFFLACVLIGLLSQTHYVSLTVAGLTGLLWLYRLAADRRINDSVKEALAGLMGFVATMAPLIAFDFRHNHLISRQFINFFFSPEKHIRTTGFVTQMNLITSKAEYLLASLLHDPGLFAYDRWVLTLGIVLMLYIAIKARFFKNAAWMITVLWLITAIVGTSFYSHSTFPHYLTYSFPLIGLFWAQVIVAFIGKKYLFSGAAVALLVFGVTVSGLPNVSWGGQGTAVLEKTVGSALPKVVKPYNLTLLSDDKDYKGMSYRYFFEVSGIKPLNPDDYGELNSLVIIDETFLDDPLSVPIYEIEAAKTFDLVDKIVIPEGPWVYIYNKR
jgi:4-amino-4-deoxy-L-arabinose transferase-like glycosyltransferase